jgi:pimeloyl-ACP methyl ester carboxylesterase
VVVVDERSFDTGEVTLNYGVAGAGDPVLLLHGGSARWQQLDHLVRGLADAWHTYAPDMRGHGRSGHTPRRYRSADYADDIVAFLEHIGPAFVFGHSLGAQVATVAAARRPDLFRALAIGDTPLSLATLPAALRPNQPMLLAWRDLAASDRSREEIATILRQQPVEFEGRSGRAEDVMPKGSTWFDFMAGCLRDLDPTMLDAVIEFDEMHAGSVADRILPGITCPILLIQADPAHGGALRDDDVALARELRPDLRVDRIAGVGHSVYPWKIEAVLREFFTLAR